MAGHHNTRATSCFGSGLRAPACRPFSFGSTPQGPHASMPRPARRRQMLGREVLVLNSNYEPLNVCNMRRAVALMLLGKAEVLQQREQPLITAHGEDTAPSVVKMRYQVRRPMPQLRLSRHSVLARDSYTCQYCG